MSINLVVLTGNLGKDPEISVFDNGGKMARFSIAVNAGYMDKNSNTWVDKTDWFNLVAFGYAATKAESKLQKGTKVSVQGSLSNRSWEDAEGNKKYATDIRVDKIAIQGGGIQSQNSAAYAGYETIAEIHNANTKALAETIESPEDDLPF